MICPYCLDNITPQLQSNGNRRVYVCPSNGCELPRDLVEKPNIPHITIGMVGFSGHGKTVFITSLFFLMKHIVRNAFWGNRFYYQCIDDNTIREVYDKVPEFGRGVLPKGTPENFPTPAVMDFNNLPVYGRCFASFYDTAGATFVDSEKITRNGRYVAASDVVFFLVSLDDIRESNDDMSNAIEKLLNTYINGVYNQLRIDLKRRQRLVVVLTKADKLNDHLPAYLKQSFSRGTDDCYLDDLTSRLDRIHNESDYIRSWLDTLGCRGFTLLAEDNFKEVAYCLVSATGCSPVNDTTVQQTGATTMLPGEVQANDPKHVVDALLLAFDMTIGRGFKGMLKRLGLKVNGLIGNAKSTVSNANVGQGDPAVSGYND